MMPVHELCLFRFAISPAHVPPGRACLNSTLAHMRALQDMMPEGAAGVTSLNMGAIGVELHGLQDELACIRTEAGALLPLDAQEARTMP